MENLFFAWRRFRRGKRSKREVQEFEWNLEDNLFKLHLELKNKIYCHSDYSTFYVTDPKLRHIHKAWVWDRVVHHAIYNILYPLFDEDFIYDSYACRLRKGTHRGVNRLEQFIRKAGDNNRRAVVALKCDVKKFFDSIDHKILLDVICQTVHDPAALWLITGVLDSFSKLPGKGLPLGNLTSQLFGNIYLNELDQFVKHQLHEKYYIRYCDDLVILGTDEVNLWKTCEKINNFLQERLGLSLHPNKVIVRKYRRGLDFLGYVVMPYHRVLRTKTKHRLFRNINKQNKDSYLGILKHCDSYKLQQSIEA